MRTAITVYGRSDETLTGLDLFDMSCGDRTACVCPIRWILWRLLCTSRLTWTLPFLHGKTQSPSAVAATRRAFDGRSATASLPASSRKRILRLGDPLWALHDECFARNMSGLARTSLCPFHWPRRSSFICVSHIMSFSASDLFRSFLYLDEQETILRLDTMLRAASDTSSADAEG